MMLKIFVGLFFLHLTAGETIVFDRDETTFAFAAAYQDNMVLQMQPQSAVLWGFGDVGSDVTVTFDAEIYTTTVVENEKNVGIWKLTLNPQPAGGPHTILASQDNMGTTTNLQLINVLFGDVWICSGQSNMQYTVSMVINATEEYNKASSYSDIRLMTPAKVFSDTPLDDLRFIQQPWSLPSEESLGGPSPWSYFSAVCWFYGRYLYDELQIPLGLISPNWGGTPVEAWSSSNALEKCVLNNQDIFRDDFDQPRPRATSQLSNSALWNAMIHPLLNMTIKGVIWYQGERNTYYHQSQYNCSFPAMIDDWRKSWFEGTGEQTPSQFPFGFVQLSTSNAKDDASFPMIRWHQTADYGYVPNPKMPNTFMAVAMDLGDFESPYGAIHPRYKRDVGSRLVLGALQLVYGRDVNPQGPYPISAVRTGDGHVVVTYPDDQYLINVERESFEICCDFSTCLLNDPSPSSNWLVAPIVDSSAHTITLQSKICLAGGGHIDLLRYAWSLSPCAYKNCSVYNNDYELPAPPFAITVTEV